MTEVSRLLATRALERPDAVALLEGATGRRLRWRDLVTHAARWERLVAERCVGPRRRVALVVDDPLTYGAAYLGCLAADLTAVPLDPRAGAADVAAAAARLRVDVVVSDAGDRAEAADRLDAWTVGPEGPQPVRPVVRGPRPSDTAALRPAALVSSSGTTGAPKGRDDILEAVLRSVDPARILFEAPTRDLQVELIRAVGPDVNLGNIGASDVVGVETLRLGLRADTLLHLTPAAAAASAAA